LLGAVFTAAGAGLRGRLGGWGMNEYLAVRAQDFRMLCLRLVTHGSAGATCAAIKESWQVAIKWLTLC
jgi:hypothetical protein